MLYTFQLFVHKRVCICYLSKKLVFLLPPAYPQSFFNGIESRLYTFVRDWVPFDVRQEYTSAHINIMALLDVPTAKRTTSSQHSKVYTYNTIYYTYIRIPFLPFFLKVNSARSFLDVHTQHTPIKLFSAGLLHNIYKMCPTWIYPSESLQELGIVLLNQKETHGRVQSASFKAARSPFGYFSFFIFCSLYSNQETICYTNGRYQAR